MTSPSLHDRLAGGFWGLLVGDALGVPYEFHPRERIPPADEIELTPPAGFVRAHRGVPPGTWSDDGAQALCLLSSLLDRDRLDLDDLLDRMVAWYEQGLWAVDGRVFDCGVQTSKSLRARMRGASAREAGETHENANGNGSLMRVLPLVLWHTGDDRDLVRCAHEQSLVTHGHPRSQVCCALYCLWARRVLDGAAEPWADAVATLRDLYEHEVTWLGELEYHVRPDDLSAGQGSGYVVDCLRSARWSVDQGPYEQVVRAAIGLGRDTDTTACVAGGIAGLRDGVQAIPARWREALRGQEMAAPLLDRVLARRR